jgi:hypothetical protein
MHMVILRTVFETIFGLVLMDAALAQTAFWDGFASKKLL